MRTAQIKTFTDRYLWLGPAVWIGSLQFYIVQFIVARDFVGGYSWQFNVISDLGNTACGQYSQGLVCSPGHNLMNASLIVLGLTMITGSLLIYQGFKESTGSLIGFLGVALSGLGSVIVGVFPENNIHLAHLIGGYLVFIIGSLSLLVLGIVLALPKPMRFYTIASGIVSLTGLPLYLSKHFLFLGIGGMERVVVYPQTIWLIIFGLYLSRNRYNKKPTVIA